MFEVEVPNVSPSEAQDLVRQGWALIDVRTDQEWADGHIAGAQHLPMNEVVAKLPQIGNQVICVCAVGARSWRVTQYLALQGLDAVNLDGGMQGWAAAGLPVER